MNDDDLPDLDSEVYRSHKDQRAFDWGLDCTKAGGHVFRGGRCIHCNTRDQCGND